MLRFSISRTLMVTGVLVLTILFAFGQALWPALAQDAEPPAEETAPVEVSAEAQTAAESQLVVSAEAQKEQAIDLHTELDLQGYDPITHADFGGDILYPLKETVWGVQEGLYNTFASDGSYAQLMEDHANKELVAAAEVYTEEPESTGSVMSILEEYHKDLSTMEELLPAVKAEDPNLAKELASSMAEDHLFMAPKVLGVMQDSFMVSAPDEVPQLVDLRSRVLGTVGDAVVGASDSSTEVVETLNILANSSQLTAFSGIVNAEILSQVREHLGGDVAKEMNEAFEQVIDVQLKTVEQNLQGLQLAPEVAADQFKNYVSQLPGQSLERLKIMDQFKSQTALPPVFIEKMQEIKARVAESIGARIKQVVEEEIRRAMSEAMLQVNNPNIDDFKILSEFEDMIPDEEIRQEISRNREQQVQTFLGRFGDDANAKAVTAEFEEISRKMESGQISPDANFFKSLESLKSRLSPEQQAFIDSMENTGREQVFERAQNDQYFAQRFATFNPADIQVYERFNTPGFGGEFGPPPGFDFAAKFREIEQQQANNFNRFLEFQNRPESVQAIRAQFENVVPQDIRQRFETQYNFDSSSFQQHEQQASEKQAFFDQKFQQIQAEYEQRFGGQAGGQPGGFPGGPPSPFPGNPGFPFPGGGNFGPGFPPPPFFQGGTQGGDGLGQPYPRPVTDIACPPGTTRTNYGCEIPFERPVYDPSGSCTASGGTWTGSYCRFDSTYQTPAYQTPTGNYQTPYGTDGQYQTPPPYLTPYGDYQTPTYQTPTGDYQTPPYYTPSGSYQTPGPYPTPGSSSGSCPPGFHWMSDSGGWCMADGAPSIYPTPGTAYPTPGTIYPTPGTAYPTPGTIYPTPGTAYPTPSTSYPTPSTSYPTPASTGSCPVGSHWMSDNGGWCMSDAGGTTAYPTPSTAYPTPSTSYPTPSTSYPTPSTSYPTPSTSYPTPSTSYPTPSTSYPTPSTSYPTPATTYPTPATTYPTPSTSYPTPATTYPTPATTYPTPATTYPTPAYAYPTPSYAYPTPAYATPATYGHYVGSVAGAWTTMPDRNLGVFDFLSLFGLGVYGFMKKRKTKTASLQ